LSYLDSFLNLLNSLPNTLLYLLLGLSAFVENVFPPIPGDTITAFGAFLVATERLSFFGVYLSTTLGSLFGFMFLFWIGSLLGRRFFIEKDYRFFRAKDIIRAEEWFRKYGYFLILLNRRNPLCYINSRGDITAEGSEGYLARPCQFLCMESYLDQPRLFNRH